MIKIILSVFGAAAYASGDSDHAIHELVKEGVNL